jgi:hypothetical protein
MELECFIRQDNATEFPDYLCDQRALMQSRTTLRVPPAETRNIQVQTNNHSSIADNFKCNSYLHDLPPTMREQGHMIETADKVSINTSGKLNVLFCRGKYTMCLHSRSEFACHASLVLMVQPWVVIFSKRSGLL